MVDVGAVNIAQNTLLVTRIWLSMLAMRIVLLSALGALLLSPVVSGEQRYTAFADPTFPIFGLSVDASVGDTVRSNWVPRGFVASRRM